jgi:hypothetical protein
MQPSGERASFPAECPLPICYRQRAAFPANHPVPGVTTIVSVSVGSVETVRRAVWKPGVSDDQLLVPRPQPHILYKVLEHAPALAHARSAPLLAAKIRPGIVSSVRSFLALLFVHPHSLGKTALIISPHAAFGNTPFGQLIAVTVVTLQLHCNQLQNKRRILYGHKMTPESRATGSPPTFRITQAFGPRPPSSWLCRATYARFVDRATGYPSCLQRIDPN